MNLGGVCLGDDQAAQVAEINWADAWASDRAYTFAVDQSYADIEPTDVLQVPLLGINYRRRQTKIHHANEVIRTNTAQSDDDGAYVSSAVAPPPALGTTILFTAPSALILMDSVLLQGRARHRARNRTALLCRLPDHHGSLDRGADLRLDKRYRLQRGGRRPKCGERRACDHRTRRHADAVPDRQDE